MPRQRLPAGRWSDSGPSPPRAARPRPGAEVLERVGVGGVLVRGEAEVALLLVPGRGAAVDREALGVGDRRPGVGEAAVEPGAAEVDTGRCARASVWARPPRRSLGLDQQHRQPGSRSRRRAAAMPAAPPPITATSTRPACPRPPSAPVRAHGHGGRRGATGGRARGKVRRRRRRRPGGRSPEAQPFGRGPRQGLHDGAFWCCMGGRRRRIDARHGGILEQARHARFLGDAADGLADQRRDRHDADVAWRPARPRWRGSCRSSPVP